jgi:hypothetical protein
LAGASLEKANEGIFLLTGVFFGRFALNAHFGGRNSFKSGSGDQSFAGSTNPKSTFLNFSQGEFNKIQIFSFPASQSKGLFHIYGITSLVGRVLFKEI